MIPSSRRAGTAAPRASRDARASARSPRARRTSSTVLTIGSMTRSGSRSGDPEERAELAAQLVGVQQPEAQAAHAEERVRLRGQWEVGERLVGAGVERADRERAAAERGGDGLVGRRLLVFVRHCGGAEEQELRAQQPDAVRAGGDRLRHVLRPGDVGLHAHGHAVEGDGGSRGGRACGGGIARERASPPLDRGQRLRLPARRSRSRRRRPPPAACPRGRPAGSRPRRRRPAGRARERGSPRVTSVRRRRRRCRRRSRDRGRRRRPA